MAQLASPPTPLVGGGYPANDFAGESTPVEAGFVEAPIESEPVGALSVEAPVEAGLAAESGVSMEAAPGAESFPATPVESDAPDSILQGEAEPEEEDLDTDPIELGIDPGFATGAYLRNYADSSLGDQKFEDVAAWATAIAADPRYLGKALGLGEQTVLMMDPLELRNRLMLNYYEQNRGQTTIRKVEQARIAPQQRTYDRLMRYARATGTTTAQLESALEQATQGDRSALNQLEERYFFR